MRVFAPIISSILVFFVRAPLRDSRAEQYPEKLKKTVAELPVVEGTVFAKTLFSMCDEERKEKLGACKSVILCGLETHVCVLQTALDFMEMGIDVHVCADAVSSQRAFDRSVSVRERQFEREIIRFFVVAGRSFPACSFGRLHFDFGISSFPVTRRRKAPQVQGAAAGHQGPRRIFAQ